MIARTGRAPLVHGGFRQIGLADHKMPMKSSASDHEKQTTEKGNSTRSHFLRKRYAAMLGIDARARAAPNAICDRIYHREMLQIGQGPDYGA